MYRNILWGLIKAVEEAGSSSATAISLMASHSPQWKNIDQVASSGGADITAGTFWYWATQHGYRRLQRNQSCRHRRSVRRPSVYIAAERRRSIRG